VEDEIDAVDPPESAERDHLAMRRMPSVKR
jgi:hypothetical protein